MNHRAFELHLNRHGDVKQHPDAPKGRIGTFLRRRESDTFTNLYYTMLSEIGHDDKKG